MRICPICNSTIPWQITINNRIYDLRSRKYCISCSPIGERRIYKNKIVDKTIIRGKSKIEKICPSCNRKVKESGRNKECSNCKNTKLRKKTKRLCIEYLGNSCKVCGYNKCLDAMDFHHRNPDEKIFDISDKLYNKFENLKEELDKCDLLCCRCHSEIHENKAPYPNWSRNET